MNSKFIALKICNKLERFYILLDILTNSNITLKY